MTLAGTMEDGSPFFYPIVDFLMTLFGFGLFLTDVALDVKMVISLYNEGEYYRMGVLVFLLVASSVLVQVFSWLWYEYDSEEPDSKVESCIRNCNLLWIFHLFLLGVFVRYLGVMEISLRIFRGTERDLQGEAVYQTHDLSMLRLMETFTESAPQLILMINIILHRGEVGLLTFVKTAGSAAAIAFTVAMYHRALRSFLPLKEKQGYGSSVVYFAWNLLLVGPRILAVALFACVMPLYVGLHFLGLWLSLVLWAYLQKTDFMDSKSGEWLYRVCVGLILYFSWFNVSEGGTLWRSIIYHTFMLVDMGILLGGWWWWWLGDTTDRFLLQPHALLIVVSSLYLLGLALKSVYYKYFHPRNPKLKTSHFAEYVGLVQVSAGPRSIDEVDFRFLRDVEVEEVVTVSSIPVTVQTKSNKRMRSLAANFYS